jgi:hypothetical protein
LHSFWVTVPKNRQENEKMSGRRQLLFKAKQAGNLLYPSQNLHLLRLRSRADEPHTEAILGFFISIALILV